MTTLSQFLESYAAHIETGFGALNPQVQQFAQDLRAWARLTAGLDSTASDVAHEGEVTHTWVGAHPRESATRLNDQAKLIRQLTLAQSTLDRLNAEARAKGWLNVEHALNFVPVLEISPEPPTDHDLDLRRFTLKSKGDGR